jgi:hypothetical protein
MSSGNLKPWKPGQSGNPAGRAVIAPELRELAKSSRATVLAAISQVMLLTSEELKEAVSEPSTTMAQHLVASVLSKAIKEGCPMRAQFLLNYILGRPAQFDPKDVEDSQAGGKQALEVVPSSVRIEVLRAHAQPK